jgi:hypothetical protein
VTVDGEGSPDGSGRPGRDVLVVGSYPPVPTAGAAATLDTVLELWARGDRPHIAAPRASAAPLTVAVSGLRAGRRLSNLRRVTGAVDVVLCVERDLPIPTGGYGMGVLAVLQRVTAQRVAKALADFEHVTLIACGDHGVPRPVWERLVVAADTVVDRPEAAGTPGVTALGPPVPLASALRHGAVALAPRLFGRHTARVLTTADRGRRWAHRIRAVGGRPHA